MNGAWCCLALVCRIRDIHQIPIHIVLQNEPAWIKPVNDQQTLAIYLFCSILVEVERANLPIIKDLTTHDVSSYAPAILIPFVTQPIMAEHLSIEVMRLKT